MVRRRSKHQRIAIGLRLNQSGGQEGRCGIASLWLYQHSPWINSGFGHLLGRDKTEIGVGDNQWRSKAIARQAPAGLLEQTTFSDKVNELLWETLARDRPQTSAGSTA
jgi:hypothetical protein